MEVINNIINGLINAIPFPMNYLILSILAVLILFTFFPLLGYLINKFEDFEFIGLYRLFGNKIAVFVVNRLTFIGIITHECAHAAFAWLCGAKVNKIKLLTFFKENELGSVQFIPRGGPIRQHLQMFFTSCAPVIVNTSLTILTIYYCKYITHWYFYILAAYLIISFMNHASMSKPDLNLYFKSAKIVIPFLIIITFIAMLLFRKV